MVIFPISIFSQIRSEGGGHRISFFSQIQNSPHYPRGGGSRKLWTFSTIWDIFFCECSPYHLIISIEYLIYFIMVAVLRALFRLQYVWLYNIFQLAVTLWGSHHLFGRPITCFSEGLKGKAVV